MDFSVIIRQMNSVLGCVFIAVFLAIPQHGFAQNNSTEALDFDLNRIVAAIELDGWFMDNKAYDEALDQFMPSICRAPGGVVKDLQNQLSLQLQENGDPRVLFKKQEKMTDEVELSLHIERQMTLLNMANKQKPNCPFWVNDLAPFTPRQSGAGRLRLAAESGGLLQFKFDKNLFKTGGGGAARFFGYYGISTSHSMLLGLESGGGAFVNPEAPEDDVDIRFFPAMPFIFRSHFGAWHFDLETALVATFSVDKFEPVPGWRAGTMVGFSTLRLRNFLPWAGLAVAVEQYPNSKEFPGYLVKVGFRAGTLLMD